MQNLFLAAMILGVIFIVAYFIFGKNGNSVSESDARKYARLLISEIKLYENYKVEQGFNNNNLYETLREEIENARTTYRKRIYAAKYNVYFEDALIEILADGKPDKLGLAFNKTEQ